MNLDRLSRLADLIEADPERFAFNSVFGELGGQCRTPPVRARAFVAGDPSVSACPAGFAAGRWRRDVIDGDGPYNFVTAASEALGLNETESAALFFDRAGSVWVRCADRFGWAIHARGHLSASSKITAAQAAEVIRMVASGDIALAELVATSTG